MLGYASYQVFFYPRSVTRYLGEEVYDIFGAERRATWQSDHGRASFLEVSFASHMNSIGDTATMRREAELLLPLAESLAARTGDTIIVLQHVRYPFSRGLPVTMTTTTYFHRSPDKTWRRSRSLWPS